MRARARRLLGLLIVVALATSTAMFAVQDAAENKRVDGAELLPIPLDGSLQNAAWSPDGKQIVFTRFRKGYNKPPADLIILDLSSASLRSLVEDGSSNVSQPGSTWNARTDNIIFSSDRSGHDEVFMIGSRGKPDSLQQLTSTEKYTSFEPSWSPNGRSFVYEMHNIDEETNGVIVRGSVGSPTIEELTKRGEDCRQPNWSPAGDVIIYQKKEGSDWDLWVYEFATKTHRRLTDAAGDKTDATFSPDGRWVVYSGDSPELKDASLFAVAVSGGRPIQITNAETYDGAPSWSPDGKYIAFESAAPRPSKSRLRSWLARILRWFRDRTGHEAETRLWKIEVPASLGQPSRARNL
jgi:TolB protein